MPFLHPQPEDPPCRGDRDPQTRMYMFFLERKMFQTRVVEKIKTHTSCSITFFFLKIVPLKDMEKYGRPQQATDGDTAHALFVLDN